MIWKAVSLALGPMPTAMPASAQVRFEVGRPTATGRFDAHPVPFPGVNHGFIGPDDATTHRAVSQALAATFAFFDRSLRP